VTSDVRQKRPHPPLAVGATVSEMPNRRRSTNTQPPPPSLPLPQHLQHHLQQAQAHAEASAPGPSHTKGGGLPSWLCCCIPSFGPGSGKGKGSARDRDRSRELIIEPDIDESSRLIPAQVDNGPNKSVFFLSFVLSSVLRAFVRVTLVCGHYYASQFILSLTAFLLCGADTRLFSPVIQHCSIRTNNASKNVSGPLYALRKGTFSSVLFMFLFLSFIGPLMCHFPSRSFILPLFYNISFLLSS
jgi:hypothetical protein